jgi:hypothetical protein
MDAIAGTAVVFHMSFIGFANTKLSSMTVNDSNVANRLTLTIYHNQAASSLALDAFAEIGSTGEYAGVVTFPSVGTWQIEMLVAPTGEFVANDFEVVAAARKAVITTTSSTSL